MVKERLRFTRRLRFRLALSFVFFFTFLLTVVGVVFRQALDTILYKQSQQVLDEEWGSFKGYLRIEQGNPMWFHDPLDPEEAFIVERLRRVYLLVDPKGEVRQVSARYQALGIDPPDEIRKTLQEVLKNDQPTWKMRKSAQGEPFLIRAGVMFDDKQKPWYLAIGRSLAESLQIREQFTRDYFFTLPGMILAAALLGWFLAGRALRPVYDVAQAAERISGSNLSLRIRSREAGDELDHLIKTFNLMMERLEESFRQTRQFSTDVSHELRTPITAIRGQLEVALFTAQTTDEYREAMLNALQEVERLSGLVRAMLLLSQAESGQLMLQKARLDFAALVRDIVDQFQIPAEEAQVRLRAELPAECYAELDRIQMERMVSNLLSNAVKYTPAGGEVRVQLYWDGPLIELIVKDTGRGIPEGDLPYIFDRFYRVPQATQFSEAGLGLGLSFVSWIVKAHGGKIDVESKPGLGTRFVVSLPAGVEQPAEERPEVRATDSLADPPAKS
jgi:heavy metal sensor kinase